MRVNYYATLRQAVGRKTEIVDLKGSQTLGNLLNAIVESHPSLTKELLDSDGTLQGHIRIFVNGEDVSYQEEISELAMGQEDKVDIFPAIGGGQ
jgi:MoaD family protein